MNWQFTEDMVFGPAIDPKEIIALSGKPPVSGAWRETEPPAERRFTKIGNLQLELGSVLPSVTLAWESWGELNESKTNAILLCHALTGDAHAHGDSAPGQKTAGWWHDLIGPGKALDTDKYFIICTNLLGGCQGSTGPASLAPDHTEWGSRFPNITIRDQVAALHKFASNLEIENWFAVIGGSMGGMHALEYAISHPAEVARLGLLAVATDSSADLIANYSLQIEAIRLDPAFAGGDYYDANQGKGPHQGLALARKIAMLGYRSAGDLETRFGAQWQSELSPIDATGKYQVESYLDFHGSKFTRRFDANSYIQLSLALISHDVARGRESIEAALGIITAKTLVLGIDSDRLFPLWQQRILAKGIASNIDNDDLAIITSEYGHDGFLTETAAVTKHLRRLLDES